MDFRESFAEALRILEPKFESGRLPFPPVSPILFPYMNYDAEKGVLFESVECPVPLFDLGKVVSAYIHNRVNPGLVHLIVDEGESKYREAKKCGFEEEWQKMHKPRYMLLYKLASLVPFFGGLLFLEEKSGKDIVNNFVVELKKSFERVKEELSRDDLAFGRREAVSWYEKCPVWLPKIARLTTKIGYEKLVREAGIDSVMVAQ